MPAPSLSFDPSQVLCTFLGAPLHGFAEGTFIKAERNEESFFLKVGGDGEAARARNKNKSGRVTFTLLQTSTGNDILSSAQRLDEIGGAGYGALLIKDKNGTTLVTAPVAWIVKPATVEIGKEIGPREWVLETGELIVFVGGNPT